MVDAEHEVDVFYGVQQIKAVRPEFVQSQVCGLCTRLAIIPLSPSITGAVSSVV
jgi:hypothetical protein